METQTVPHTPFASTREQALQRWADFAPAATSYARDRNFVKDDGHPAVTRLSPAIRMRLVREPELVTDLLSKHSIESVEKLAQELYWRGYWKGWLEWHPGVWADYLKRVASAPETYSEAVLARAREVAEGRSGVPLMDRFARELIETGYVHNHARMWWSSFWVHIEGLPWELGAAWYERHLLDADAATNTLSWRWVAGLQTKDKSYLVRRSNLERFADPALLAETTGLDLLNDKVVTAVEIEETADLKLAVPQKSDALPTDTNKTGLWLHDEDLSVEHSGLRELRPAGIVGSSPSIQSAWASQMRTDYAQLALADGLARASKHFGMPSEALADASPAALAAWATARGLTHLVALRPFTGRLVLDEFRDTLKEAGVELICQRRVWDQTVISQSQRGFFPYWEVMRKRLAKRQMPLE